MDARHAHLLTPFWHGSHMTREPLLFIGEARASCRARLLNAPVSQLVISDATGSVNYHAHDDFILEADTGCIIRPPGSRMPCVPPEATRAVDPALLHSAIVSVDYIHAAREWFDSTPLDRCRYLPRTSRVLRAGDPLTIAVVGDSISEGYDATGFRGVPPFQAPYVELIAEGIRATTHSSVHLHNHAVAGWTTEDAAWQIPDAARSCPDLAIIAFGMNDATYAEPPAFADRVAALARQFSVHSADTEFVLVTPMLPTPACTWVDAARIEEYRAALRSLEQPGMAVADVTDVWRALLTRKHPLELSGNGTNHPNDFGHRIYAHTVLAALGVSS